MMEPFFFDCLTDAQIWSLFDAEVLHACMLPTEVYERLQRIAPDHGCVLFTWPTNVAVPSLQDIASGVGGPVEEPSATVERFRSAIEAFCVHLNTESLPEDRRIYVISTTLGLELRAGPHLEPRARDLNAMSLAELEAYLNDVLRVDGGHAWGSPAST